MKRLILFLLIFPALLLAGNLIVKKPEKFTQPTGAIERVSKRTENGKVYEQDSIGSGRFMAVIFASPIHYLDSAGVYRDFSYDAQADTVSGFTVVRTGKFDIAYDSTGAIRYQKKDALLTISPKFDRSNIDIEFSINQSGLKANYILKNSNAPATLKWLVTANDTIEDQRDRGKGVLKKAGKIKGAIQAFTAVDALMNPVNLTAGYKKDSLVVTLDTVGAVFPITLDPSINDTTVITSATTAYNNALATWALARDATTSGDISVGLAYTTIECDKANDYRLQRAFWKFPLKYILGNVDSVRLRAKPYNLAGGEAIPGGFIFCKGNFTGVPNTGWFNDFVGWTPAAPHTIIAYTDSLYRAYSTDTSNFSCLFNAAGKSAIDSLNNDTLRLALIANWDKKNIAPTSTVYNPLLWLNSAGSTYLTVYYTSWSLPSVSSVDDTLYRRVVLVGNITSTGGKNSTIRGFKHNKITGDTSTVSESGSFGAGSYTLVTGSLTIGQTIYWRAFATNPVGTTYGAVDSFQIDTTGTAGTIIKVDGRIVNTVR